MDSNYHWQKQRANERIQDRLHDAEQHRHAKQQVDREKGPVPIKFLITGIFVVVIAIWLLTGCTMDSGPSEVAHHPGNHVPMITMADKIRIQDKLEATFISGRKFSPSTEMTMDQRINFQDKRDGYLLTAEIQGAPPANWEMIDRIRFHDRLWQYMLSKQ